MFHNFAFNVSNSLSSDNSNDSTAAISVGASGHFNQDLRAFLNGVAAGAHPPHEYIRHSDGWVFPDAQSTPSFPYHPPPFTTPGLSTSISPIRPDVVTKPLAISPESSGRRPEYSGKDYLGLAAIVVDLNPFGAKHGKKGAVWEEVAKACKAQGLFLTSSTDVIKNKAMALIKYQEKPESAAGTKLAKEMSSTTGISIAALLDRASEKKRIAEDQSEEQKEKTRVKDENDRKGGQAICDLSMRTMGHRKRELSTELNSDAENEDPQSPQSRPTKRRRIKGTRGSSEVRELRDLMEKTEKRRGQFEEKIVMAMKDSTKVYEQAQDRFINLLTSKLT